MQNLQTGSTLQSGRYKIEKMLGQGGFGITYLAEQSGLERKVAIKEFFMKELCNRDESTSHVTLGTEGSRETVNRFRDKFLKEARNISKLNHPNIVRIIDVFEENGTAYYVMEYAENGSLADKVKHKGYLAEPVATRYILQVAEALDYIHQQKMNHLDVKPANIMLNEKDESVLIDFGLSKQYDAATGNQTSTTPVGISEGYAPMEQYMQGGVSAFSPETDIYSLGATFYKLLTGLTPPNASFVNNEGLPVDELQAKGVSQKAIDIICKAMEGRKKDRMKSVSTFIKMLNKSTREGKNATLSDSAKTKRAPLGGKSNTNNPEDTAVINESRKKEKVYPKKTANFQYPLTIFVNKKVYTECQLWTIEDIKLLKNKTVVNATLQSLNEFTTAWTENNEQIITDKGASYQLRNSSLPAEMDEDFVLEPWETIEVTDIYPPIPNDVNSFSINAGALSLHGININNGRVIVPEANTTIYDGTTPEEIAKLYNCRNKKSFWNKLLGN